ncbi:Putative monooxygenase OS=Tsukamurella paurometabola (strain ATCC 8368 / DSM / CCUG 35730 /CIP 100753 / JCM 10117 / KCTC 9821 / NBRC 16120 / NCIMB 702349/ NCTC 13040) OX=521096 GN=Tpau_2891 PE=3 SV=1 [Tsukamurella paurometabola]|uniref:Putative monooxygenase n=1 Tax=Tsukamurella paurometabola (strain ATCC 8368 / DSM 20162 / CCUG 35730 / CIP 100753 / JCM 10117 / KCTC 9821 / NBRC 16120 / NCIMB 702349 / NCTC 13040) TaxID=521096 RepID=D5UTY6_TSUPD|nr:NAD(P)/FAD-dependent oxidoreductase [Tsukamurella paurometabola]ADG79489.1 putative monooxygenase [Tsukamurella paurometabola DSM 20162]SUP35953.1 FAD-containing monooxygenase EthA [Tsukamurella paurometabola]
MNASTTQTDDFDLVIIGAGIAGIGAAKYFTEAFPGKRIAMLEGRANIGGTWDLFKYPGIRSDNGLHTYGYEFKAWTDPDAIAEAPKILNYLQETVDEYDLGGLIRFEHSVQHASWSSADARWTLDVRTPEGAKRITTKWVFAGTGYYRYDEGYTPHFEGREDFQGDILHPQHWPEDYDYAGKKVVVIGSGATAVTMIPSMLNHAGAAAHVTMLQRTPTYVVAWPKVDSTALLFTKWFGEKRGYAVTRFTSIWAERGQVKFMRAFPRIARALVRLQNKSRLPQDYAVDTHFNPPYDPWDQRLCLSPDGDFFAALSGGDASVTTDKIERFTETGIALESGEHLDADVIVTATGLNMRLLGGIEFDVDGAPVSIPDTVAYRGTLLTGLPNLSIAIGYTTSAWTLKIGIVARYICDLIKHMDAFGYDSVRVEADPAMERRPILDLDSGYAQRARDVIPKQGTGMFQMSMSYQQDAKILRGPLLDDALQFGSTRDEGAGAPTKERVDA